MNSKEKWVGVLIGLAGTGLCLTALVTFFSTIVNNALPWHSAQTAQEHYLAVGRSFSQGFSVGFFLCFFITVTALVVGSWWRERRARAAQTGGSPEVRPIPALARKTQG